MLKKGAKLTRSLIPILLSAVAEKYIDTKILKEAFQKLTEEAASIFEEEVNEYANKKKGLEDFKKELEAYISKLEKKPLVFFIDELDRCNPKYAVEFLEVIKHFFSVPGIVFVLSIDKEQLGNSIRGYFGSEHINTDEYLRRFIDLEFSIPAPDLTDYIHYMYQKTGVYEFVHHDNRRMDYAFRDESEYFYNLAVSFFSNSDVNLRLIEKILNHTSLILKTFHLKAYTNPQILFTLVFIKFLNVELYKKIKDHNLTPQGLLDELFAFLSPKIKINKNLNLGYFEALFLVFYCKGKNGYRTVGIWEEIGDSKKLLVESRFSNFISGSPYNFESYLKNVEDDWNRHDINIHDVISRVELFNNLRET